MAKISPSKLDYLKFCPKFAFEEFVSNEAAEEGTMLHGRLETGEFDGLEGEQLSAVETAQEAMSALQVGWLGWQSDSDGYVRLPELKLECRYGLRGTSDLVCLAFPKRRALAGDWKLGRLGLITTAENCLQLRAYADAVFARWAKDIDEVLVALVAPRTEELETHVYTRDSIEAGMKEIDAVIKRADDPFAPPTPHDLLCGKCAHRARCPAFQTAIVAPATEAALTFPVASLLAPVDTLTETEISQNLAMIDLLVKYAEARKPLLTQRVFESGLEVPGYSRREREGNAYVSGDDVLSVYEKLRGAMSVEDFLSCCGKPGLSKLAEKLAETGGTKREARQAVEDALGDLVKRGSPVRFLQRSAKLSSELLLKEPK